MKPIYLDLHIHTSDDPSNLSTNYKLDELISKVTAISKSDDFLISFTDHNTINEKVYLEAFNKAPRNIIVGVELHISSHEKEESTAYHCHIYFNFDKESVDSVTIHPKSRVFS